MRARLVLVGLLLTAAAWAADPPKQADPAKAAAVNRLAAEVPKLRAAGKLDEAAAVIEKALDLIRGDVGDKSQIVASWLNGLAEVREAQEKFELAEKARKEVVDICAALYGKADWRTTDARLAVEQIQRVASLKAEQRANLRRAESLNGESVQLYGQGNYAAAIERAEKVTQLLEGVLGDNHTAAATSYYNLARIYQAQGAFGKAEPLFQKALAVQCKNLGEDHPVTARSFLSLAVLYESQRAFGKAEPLLRKTLEIHRKVFGDDHPDTATSYHHLAVLHQAQGDYDKAEPLFQKALAIRQRDLGEEHLVTSYSYNDLALLYKNRGAYGKAEPLFQKALVIQRKNLGEDHPDTATSYHHLASLYDAQGMYAKAEPLYEKALAIYRKALGDEHRHTAASYHSLAELYRMQGTYGKAETLYQKSLAICQKTLGEQHPDTATCYENLGALYYAQGKYGKAEALFWKALEIKRKTLGDAHPSTAISSNNLAALYSTQGENGKAEPLYQKALEINRKALGDDHPDTAANYDNLATVYQNLKAYSKAMPLYQKALAIRQKALGDAHPDTANSYNNLAAFYGELGAYSQAEPLHLKSLLAMSVAPADAPAEQRLRADSLRPLPETIHFATNYAHMLASSLKDRDSLRRAERAYGVALAVKDRLRSEVLSDDESKLFHGGQHQSLIPGRLGLLHRLFDAEGNAADLETAVATVEQGTARVFLEQLGKARAAQVGRVDLKFLRQEADFKGQLNALDKLIAQEQSKPGNQRSPERVGELFAQQKTIEAKWRELVQQLEKDYPQFAALKYPKPCSLAEARACLADNEIALLFVPGSDQSYVVVVEARPKADDKTHGIAIVPLPKEEELADGLSRLSDRNTFLQTTTSRAAGEDAYDLLLASVKDRIKGKDLVIVPAGPLCQIPFEALRENGQFLIERHRIRYAPSLTALHLIRQWEEKRGKTTAPLWAVGDPLYDVRDVRTQEVAQREGRRDDGFPRLVNSGVEVRDIAGLLKFPANSIRLGREASEAAVKAASKDGSLVHARYVHFACHGILGFDVGQQPALVLSLVGTDDALEEDGGRNDGFLRLDEVTRLQMNADLVVLSACRTGQGRLNNGEGVTGLARAFLYAGSRGVLSSLWSVDDAETSRFMVDVYGDLKEGKPTASAVRAAKLKMIREGKPPVFWAPFIHIGT